MITLLILLNYTRLVILIIRQCGTEFLRCIFAINTLDWSRNYLSLVIEQYGKFWLLVKSFQNQFFNLKVQEKRLLRHISIE